MRLRDEKDKMILIIRLVTGDPEQGIFCHIKPLPPVRLRCFAQILFLLIRRHTGYVFK